MRLDILNINGQATGRTVELPSDIFEIAPNEHVIYLSVKEYMANQRQGTHDSKERNEVWRTTKKFKKQKGTGGARAGSLKNPMFKGGGRAFDPHPREYNIKLNKKVKVWVGRKINARLANAGAIDGAQVELKLKSFSAGLVGGSRPDYINYRIQLHGVFVWKKPSKDIYPSS